MNNILYYIHFIILIAILSIPFLPMKLIKKGIYIIPLIITIGWLVFDGCIITNIDKDNNITFLKRILTPIFPNITNTTISRLSQFVLTLILTIIIYRLINKKVRFIF